jgi:hypothetical protein
MERRSLAMQTLPSLTSFDVSVDLRFKFDKDEIADRVAVALVHIGTDVTEEMWLQLSRGDIDMILQSLTETLRRMDAVEKFCAQRTIRP